MSKEKFRSVIRYIMLGLPLAGVTVANFLNISARSHQFLVLIVLIWFQVFLLFEVFFGK
ncbi:MAG: hypothetical protein NTW32_16655 [Chloroflexi bacterium]|nr:hypothetical protein [Chloroflexota bacterium]